MRKGIKIMKRQSGDFYYHDYRGNYGEISRSRRTRFGNRRIPGAVRRQPPADRFPGTAGPGGGAAAQYEEKAQSKGGAGS